MKIITVNLPQTYLKMIDGLTGENALYPSRSELIRVAVRDFLIRELEAAKSFSNYYAPKQSAPIVPTPEVDPNLFVQIPIGSTSNGVPEFKTFRLIKKDHNESEVNQKSEQRIEPKKESVFKTPTSQNPYLNQKSDSDSMENVELEDYIQRNDKLYSQNKYDRNITPKLKPIDPPTEPHVPQYLAEPEEINIGGRIVKVIKR